MHLNQRQLFQSYIAQTSDAPLMLEIERADGVYLQLKSGQKLIDLIGGISVCNVGHSHPRVVEAVQNQAASYMHTMVYGEMVQAPQVQYASLLAKHLPPPLNNVYFTNSGAEATEGALKLAKRFTGRSELIYFQNAYHGSTHGALSVMGDEHFKGAFRPLLPNTRQLRYGNVDDLEHIGCHTAAVIMETVQAESGVSVPSAEFMQMLRTRCTETGALLLLDEIQAGMGRTGKLFAFEHFGITPDVLLLAKAFGGGMPLGAFIASKEIMSSLSHHPVLGHITTFGGHPVSCAAGLAALQTLLDENLIEQVEDKGKLFDSLLNHHSIRAKNRKGLMMALAFESFEQNKNIIDCCITKGVFTDWFLFAPHCLRISPPLTISTQEIEDACRIVVEAVDEVC